MTDSPPGSVPISQKELDVLASTLGLKYQVEDNLSGGRALFSASITLTNRCDIPLKYYTESTSWRIFFCHLRMVEPTYLPLDDSVDLQYAGVRFAHLNGSIFSLSPLKNFKTLEKGDSVLIKFNGQHYSASRTDILPNWYIQVDGLEPRIIKSTEGESLDFVGDFDSPKKYKRFDYVLASGKRRYDTYQPFSPEVRFLRYLSPKEDDDSLQQVVPTPASFQKKSDKSIDIYSGGWKIMLCEDADFLNEAQFLSERINIPLSEERRALCEGEACPSKVIAIRRSEVKTALANSSLVSESYEISVDAAGEFVLISAKEAAGAFYGIQSLLSLSSASSKRKSGQIPECLICDTPRFPYRGMHVDISRNFQSKSEIFRVLEVMSMYKLNKFHFHLTDDEGWRLEIPGLEELVEMGSKRGHDPDERECLLPLLGSGPSASGLGCGYYTVEEYREILRFAKARHIEVIPEIDMPGHSHAAVRAMKVRYDRLMAKDEKAEAEKYLLCDPGDGTPKAYSVQMIAENAMNPALESTYAFVEKVIVELKKMHEDIQPLTVFHLGGDEVPYEAWDVSLSCVALVESGKVEDMDGLMEYFVLRVAELVHKHGLELGAWQDGIVMKNKGPYNRKKFPNRRVLVHFWRNAWETGQAFDAFKLANDDYEVILSPGTHLYFDHPYEPDPEERGLFWACRFVDTRKVFSFAPDNLMSNADVKLTGEKMTKNDRKMLQLEYFTTLKKPQNIKGLQGQIWTELVRTPSQFHEMIFPRLIALAERAWHRCDWEDQDYEKRTGDVEADWSRFAHSLGHKELYRLESSQVPYHIPPPGARITGDGQLELRSCYPGQPLSYSLDNGQTWQEYSTPTDVAACEEVLARVSSHNGRSHSRCVKVSVKSYTDSDEQES
ncbi:beta-hexosaminidase [Aplysia californica]|uniref:beta-N-acetylhexosaminidase n=1 Tax=Aplysia californica TaxID=6500 RepID=A0ABM0JF54_APLCA|nr:beta-hexosaminidase [Aplysia californica]